MNTVRSTLLAAAAALLLLGGCASDQLKATASSPTLASFTHDDLLSAAAYASANGYPARAAVYTAIDAQLTACEAALAAARPAGKPTGAGLFTAFEVAAEAVGTGIPAAVRINCSAVTLP